MSLARKALLSALALTLVVGCAPKKAYVLQGDTAYEMQSSIMFLAQDLPAGRRQEFEQAVETIMLVSTDRRLLAGNERLSPQAMSLLRGRSVSQVIENAKLIRSASGAL
jgi:hypothetical protein